MYLCELGEDELTGCYSAAEKMCVVAMAVVRPFICTGVVAQAERGKKSRQTLPALCITVRECAGFLAPKLQYKPNEKVKAVQNAKQSDTVSE